jgi:hypothetical protein
MARLLKLSPSSQEDIMLSSRFEERKGLLSGIDTLPFSEAEEPKLSSTWLKSTLLSLGPTRIAVVISALFGLVLGVFYWLSAPECLAKDLHFNGDTLRSNGTHDFKRTVILVSIDGLRDAILMFTHRLVANIIYRADYLDRGLTPHLLDISKEGLRAKFMKPVFPVSSSCCHERT